MWKFVVIAGCVGLLAACTGPVRDPALGSASAPGAGTSGPAPGALPLTGATPRKTPKTASSQKDRSAGHPKAPKRTTEHRGIQKTAADAKAPSGARARRPVQEIPLD